MPRIKFLRIKILDSGEQINGIYHLSLYDLWWVSLSSPLPPISFRASPRIQATKDRGNERGREKSRAKERERERERVHAGSRVYTRITQTVVGELTYCNYRGNYCRHISRIRCVASLCCSVARLEFSCSSTRQLAG